MQTAWVKSQLTGFYIDLSRYRVQEREIDTVSDSKKKEKKAIVRAD